MTIEHDIRDEAEEILGSLGLASVGLAVADGFANVVLLTDNHVIRLNDGRFPGAFAHEAKVLTRLPRAIPHPEPIAHGTRRSGGEYLILERLPGVNLDIAWSTMSDDERRLVGLELGRIIRSLHSLPVADWMANPWVEHALATGAWGDAYHAPPVHFEAMIQSAGRRRPDLQPLLTAVAGFIAARMTSFEAEPAAFIHTDLHFRNVMVERGHVSGLIDFEGSRIGPPRVELDMLLRTMSPDDPNGSDRRSLVLKPIADVYPDLFAHRDLMTRLEVDEALWQLVQLHHWRPGQRWMDDPGELLRRLLGGAFRTRTDAMLNDACRS